MSKSDAPASVIPSHYDPKIGRVFRIIARRMIGKNFHALRMTEGSLDRFDAAGGHDGPIVVCMTHAGWWDPMFALLMHIERWRAKGAERDGIAPIDKAVLNNVGIFKKLGLFGINPDDPASKEAMVEYAIDRLSQQTRPTLWITPQGRFQDPRDDVEVRPGVSAILSRLENARAFVLAMEYPFWDDQKPEMLGHFVEIETPVNVQSTTAWHRAVSSAMPLAVEDLAELAMTRDPNYFDTLLGDRGGKTFFVYDWWLKATGKSTNAIRTRRAPS